MTEKQAIPDLDLRNVVAGHLVGRLHEFDWWEALALADTILALPALKAKAEALDVALHALAMIRADAIQNEDRLTGPPKYNYFGEVAVAALAKIKELRG